MTEMKQTAWYNGKTAAKQEVIAFMQAGEPSAPNSPTSSDSNAANGLAGLLLPSSLHGSQDSYSQFDDSDFKRTDSTGLGSNPGKWAYSGNGNNGGRDDSPRSEKRENDSFYCNSSHNDSSWSEDSSDDSLFGFNLTDLFKKDDP
jgi:hypothetical protein